MLRSITAISIAEQLSKGTAEAAQKVLDLSAPVIQEWVGMLNVAEALYYELFDEADLIANQIE